MPSCTFSHVPGCTADACCHSCLPSTHCRCSTRTGALQEKPSTRLTTTHAPHTCRTVCRAYGLPRVRSAARTVCRAFGCRAYRLPRRRSRGRPNLKQEAARRPGRRTGRRVEEHRRQNVRRAPPATACFGQLAGGVFRATGISPGSSWSPPTARTANSYGKAEVASRGEARALDQLIETAEYAPRTERKRIQADAACYARAVRTQEWRRMADGKGSMAASVWSTDVRRAFRPLEGEPVFGMLIAADNERSDEREERLPPTPPPNFPATTRTSAGPPDLSAAPGSCRPAGLDSVALRGSGAGPVEERCGPESARALPRYRGMPLGLSHSRLSHVAVKASSQRFPLSTVSSPTTVYWLHRPGTSAPARRRGDLRGCCVQTFVDADRAGGVRAWCADPACAG